MKRFIGCLTAFCLILNTCALPAFAAEDKDNDREFLSEVSESFEKNTSQNDDLEYISEIASVKTADGMYKAHQSDFRKNYGKKSLCIENERFSAFEISGMFSAVKRIENANYFELTYFISAEQLSNGGSETNVRTEIVGADGSIIAENEKIIKTDKNFDGSDEGFEKITLAAEINGAALKGGILRITVGNEQSYPKVTYVDDVKINAYNVKSKMSAEGTPNVFMLLKTLGINCRMTDNYYSKAVVTRADFAEALAGLMEDFSPKSDEIRFEDVYREHYAYNAIKIVSDYGIMSGSGDKTFEPDTPMTYIEALTALLKLMGYSDFAQRNGGYPAGYWHMAMQKGILTRGISADTVLTHELCARLIEKALVTSVLLTDTVTVEYGKYFSDFKESDEKTILNVFRGINRGKAILDATMLGGLNGINVNGNTVMLDGEIYNIDTDIIDADKVNELIGCNVEFYYRAGNDGNGKIVFMSKSDLNRILTVERHNVYEVSGTYIKYTDGDVNKSINIFDCITLYNGQKCTFSKSVLDGAIDGVIDFIDNNGDGKYEVMNINSFSYYAAEQLVARNMTVTDKFTNGILKSDEYENVFVYNEYGKKIAFSDIKIGNVLRIKTPLDGNDKKFISITVYDGEKVATVESIGSGGALKRVKLDGEWYDISLWAKKLEKDKAVAALETGESYTFYSCGNRVVGWLNAVSGETQVGFIYKGKTGAELDKTVTFKMMTENQEKLTLDCEKKVTVDNYRISTDDTEFISKFFEGGNVKEQIVKYKLNSKGKIVKIDTFSEYDGTNLEKGNLVRLSQKVTGLFTKRDLWFFHPYIAGLDPSVKQYTVSYNAKVFQLPKSDVNKGDENYYKATTANSLGDYQQKYEPELYALNGLYNVADYLVIRIDQLGDGVGNFKSYLTVIKSVERTTDDEDNEILKIEGIRAGAEVSVTAVIDGYADWEKLSTGDLIYFEKNAAGTVNLSKKTEFKLVADLDFETGKLNNISEGVQGEWAHWYTAAMSVYEVRDGYIFLNHLSDKGNKEPNRAYPYDKFSTYIVDTKQNLLYKGSATEAVQYVNDPDNASTVWLNVNDGFGSLMVIYK